MTPEARPATGKTIGGPESTGLPPRTPRTALGNVFLVLVPLAVTFTILEMFFRFTGTERYLFPMVKISDNASVAFHIPGAPPRILDHTPEPVFQHRHLHLSR